MAAGKFPLTEPGKLRSRSRLNGNRSVTAGRSSATARRPTRAPRASATPGKRPRRYPHGAMPETPVAFQVGLRHKRAQARVASWSRAVRSIGRTT
ncbi:hypothetical protein B4Q13_20680 [Lacticaseibacillus rhamnosus]